MGIESEALSFNHYQIDQLERLHFRNPTEFLQLIELMPISITISNVDDWEFSFINKSFSDIIFTDLEYVREKGVAYTAKLIHPENLAYIKSVLKNYSQGDSDKVQAYFQCFKPELKDDYSWCNTYKKHLNSNQYLSISHSLDDLVKTSSILRDYLGDTALGIDNYKKFLTLTAQEMNILKLVIDGESNSTIGEKLFISKHTVRTHRNRITKKLDVKQFRDYLKFELFF